MPSSRRRVLTSFREPFAGFPLRYIRPGAILGVADAKSRAFRTFSSWPRRAAVDEIDEDAAAADIARVVGIVKDGGFLDTEL